MTEKTRESDVAFIKALAELLTENDLGEIRVKRKYGEDDGIDVRVSRAGAMAAQHFVAAPAQAAPAPAAAAPAAAPISPESEGDPAAHPGAVTSPMVGTIYLQAEPGAAPFVKVGDSVSEGDTVLIIEAMKTMNQIPAPRAGTVKRILVEDGAPVEFGAPLMIIE
ncbi:acetyl-CoA carboxylase biotin carboxyl carrier protein [Sinisalibacter lacisalsi]|uniref:Biotin carboxyl carrier protein of acetyl-CoA carboxylase n=1 Tax=Sinisalibacter lacisalsi TaxID=1526570 RepID=A0ABQ1QVJ9_9RHOB|nr:acetyl-CoA carboxylase biotin carboxyl carrier protein [Sinisalibacter lacisalsi]GGD44270.1 acetyl-CoA carboxylase, biotin carboxyl carrier protein [Sinisalibacter lacisalsi]